MPHIFPGLPEFPDSDSVTLKRIASAIESSKSGVASASPLYVVGNLKTSSASIIRPNTTITYNVNAVISRSTNNPILTFPNVARGANLGGYIQRVNLIKSTASAANTLFRLHLWRELPNTVSTLADNATFTSPFSNREFYIGYVQLGTMLQVSPGNAAYFSVFPINLPFITSGSNELYGCLQALAGYTGSISEEFHVQLVADCY